MKTSNNTKNPGVITGPVMLFLTAILLNASGNSNAQSSQKEQSQISPSAYGFIENRGQITDQNFSPNPGVRFLLNLPGLNVQLKNTSFSYDTYVTRETRDPENKNSKLLPHEIQDEKSVSYIYHRIDIEFIGASTSPQLIAENAGSDFINYYTSGTPEEGIRYVAHYGKVTYKELYPGIDLEFIARPGTKKPVEYNFIVHPGADISRVRWKYNGSPETSVSGENITIKTMHGVLEEKIPYTYEKEGGRKLTSRYREYNDGTFGFKVQEYDRSRTLIIDPLPDLKWGTYYGGTAIDNTYSITTDATGNMFFTGATTSTTSIATSGAYQTTFAGLAGYGSGGDAFIAKFNSVGSRIWSTYFGGTNNEYGQSIKLDLAGSSMFVYGTTSSLTGLATTGAFQTTQTGSYNDAFLAKFDGSGARVWGTFFGGTGNDRSTNNGMVLDGNGDVYITGTNNTANNMWITTVGAYQRTNGSTAAYDEPFVAKFSPSGSLIWGTYYGGVLHDQSYAIALDASNNVYITGAATSTGLIATSGAYQTSLAGAIDAFIAKISPTGGSLIWATYYGGSGNDVGTGISVDASGNIIATGYSASASGISTSGAFQTTNGGGTYDGFLVKFNSSGVRQWGTYYGSTGEDVLRSMRTDAAGNIYVAGDGTSTTGIATTGAYQTTFGGVRDVYLSKFNTSGSQLWGSYYGGTLEDLPFSLEMDPSGNLFVSGRTVSTSGIATSGAFQTIYGGGTYDGFMARFQELVGYNNAGISRMTNPSGFLCAGSQDVKVEIINSGLNTINSLTVNWRVDGTAQTPVSITVPLSPGLSREITLGNISFPVNTLKTIKAWTSSPNSTADTVNADDSIQVLRKPGLNGTYTIGGTSPNYATFALAVADLNAYGVCGPVVFTIAAGSFNERISINPISGSSLVNNIVFRGAGKGSTVLYSVGTVAADMVTLMMNGADHTTFRDMTIANAGTTFGAALWITNASDSNRFVNLALFVDTSSTSANVNAIIGSGSATLIADGSTGSGILFDSLEVRGGHSGIRFYGVNTTTFYAQRNQIRRSSFSNQYQYGIYLRGQTLPVVSHNIIAPPRFTTSYGLYLEYSSNAEVEANMIRSADQGIYLNNVNRNLLISGFVSRIFNNMVSSTSGYGLYSTTSSLLNIWHNSFSASSAVSVIRFVSSLTMDIRNNHIQNRNSATGIYVLQADNLNTFLALDYNNYFSASGFVYISSSHYANLPVLQAAFAQFNQNTYSQNPQFLSNTDLHTSINLSGVYAGIDEDIDDDFRNTIAPVLGADEVNIPNNAGIARLISPSPVFCAGPQDVVVRIGNYGINALDSVRVYWQLNGASQNVFYNTTSIAVRGVQDINLGSVTFASGEMKKIKVWTAWPNGAVDSLANNDTLQINVKTGMSGSYTIGGTQPDYGDITEAINNLTLLGICDPVVFDIRAGTYNEKLVLRPVKGSSAANTITFRGAGKTNTNISYSGTSTADWATLFFDGADHIIFRDMTISAMGANFGICVLLTKQADSNRFVNMTITNSVTSASLNLAGIAVMTSATDFYAAAGQPGHGNTFDSLEVSGGYYGIYLAGKSSFQSVTNSLFSVQNVSSIYCSSQDRLVVNHNKVGPLRNLTFSYAIYLAGLSNFEAGYNTINTGGLYGLYVQGANMAGWNNSYRSRIYNNMVSNTSGYAFNCENSQWIYILHNSFRSVGNVTGITAAANFTGTNMELRNNHIRNDNPNSFALMADINTFDSVDNNNYYSFGSFVNIGTTFTNLSALKAAFLQFNQNSYSQDPQFYSLTDLHTKNFISGTWVGVEKDIDGEARCPQTVSVGADDDNWGFTHPVISAANNNFLTNYPLLFTHNLQSQQNKPILYHWYVDGVWVTDSSTLQQVFAGTGSHTIKLIAERCVYTDSNEIVITILSGKPVFTMLGNNPFNVRVFTSFADPGATAKSNLGVSLLVNSGNNVNTSLLGTYFAWYTTVDAFGNSDSISRQVDVIDDVEPQLALTGPDTIVIEVFGSINDPGATVSDNYYIGLGVTADSSQVNKNVVGMYQMIYSSTDGSGNTGTIIRRVKVVDTGRPVITLIGTDTIKVNVFSQYFEPGARVTDNYCTSGLQWDVDIYPSTNTLTTYTLTYTATDCQGNNAVPVTRIVKVVDREKPSITMNGFANVTTPRWADYVDDGVSIEDNYYDEQILQDTLTITSNINIFWPGTYNICYQVTDPSGNRSTKVCRSVEVTESTTGINLLGADAALFIYPNPGNGRFTIQFGSPLSKEAEITLTDATGKLVFETGTMLQQSILNMEHLPSGIYHLRVNDSGRYSTLKLAIIR